MRSAISLLLALCLLFSSCALADRGTPDVVNDEIEDEFKDLFDDEENAVVYDPFEELPLDDVTIDNSLNALSNVKNILLLGVDSRGSGITGRTDTMMLLSVDVNRHTIRLVSFMRDLYVEIPGNKSNRMNAAYVFGGYDLLAKTIEKNFGIRPDALNRRCIIQYSLPKEWEDASISTPYLSYTFHREGDRLTYDVTQYFNQPLEIDVRIGMGDGTFVDFRGSDAEQQHFTIDLSRYTLHEEPTAEEFIHEDQDDTDIDMAGLADFIEGTKQMPVDLSKLFNANVDDIFRNEYLTPRPPYTTLSLPKQGIGQWCIPDRTAHIEDDGLRAKSVKGVFDTGVGISSVTEYYLASASSSGVTTSTSGWTTSVQSVTTSKKYLWNYEKITFSDGSTSTTIPAIIGVYGDTGAAGKGISSITEYYLASASSSGVTRSTSGWTTSVQSVTNSKKYLWNYEKIVYTDNTESYTTPVIIGTYGDKGDKGDSGVGIGSITEYYLASASNSGVTTSTSGWTTTVQSMTASKRYLWNYEIVTYSDGTTQSTTPHIIGTYGDTGVGVSSITEYYLASASVTGVTRSTSGWTTAVQTVDSSKKYLWNYEKVTYTDNSTSYTTPVIIGVYGDKGDKGDKGDTGDRGYSGCVYRVTVWQTGKQYRNDQYLNTNDVRYIDICVDQPMAIIGQTTVHVYMCETTHTSSNSIPLGNTSYWTELQSAAPMFTPFMLAQAISADYINCAEIAANSAFISALTAEQAFIDALVVTTLDTKPSQTGNKIRIDGDGFSLFDSNSKRKIKIDNNTVGLYDDLIFTQNPNYTSSGLVKTRTNSVYVYSAQENRYFGGELIGHLNLGYCDKGSVIKLTSVSLVIAPTSTNSNITMYMNTPQLDVKVFKDGTCVATGTVAVSSVSCGMGSQVQISGTLNINYTTTEDGMYTLRIYTHTNSGPVTATSTCYLYSSSGSGVVNITTNTTWKFSLTRSNYEYTHIGNDGMMQVFGSGFLYNSSQEFVVRKGTYMFRLSSSGIQKSINGGQTWTSL